jgi:hypothetical protein
MSTYGYEVKTDVVGTEIHQEVWSSFELHRELVYKSVINTAETQIREALIGLGWTPPTKKENDNG